MSGPLAVRGADPLPVVEERQSPPVPSPGAQSVGEGESRRPARPSPAAPERSRGDLEPCWESQHEEQQHWAERGLIPPSGCLTSPLVCQGTTPARSKGKEESHVKA